MDRPTLNPGVWEQDPIDGRKFRQFAFTERDGDQVKIVFRSTLSAEFDGKPKQEQIDAMNLHYDNWYTMTNRSAADPTPEELAQQLRDAKRASLDAQMRVLDLEDQFAQQIEPPIVEEVIEDSTQT